MRTISAKPSVTIATCGMDLMRRIGRPMNNPARVAANAAIQIVSHGLSPAWMLISAET